MMTVAQLLEVCEQKGIKMPKKSKKADIIAVLKATKPAAKTTKAPFAGEY